MLKSPRIILDKILEHPNIRHENFLVIKKKVAHQCHESPPSNSLILAQYRELVKTNPTLKNEKVEDFLRMRKVRTLSGVAIVTVLTKPYPCPGKCAYCPLEARMPKSYLSSEPAAARALRQGFDPYKQVWVRLEALYRNGHITEKIELIVKGGTWSSYPKSYQRWFIGRCFEACNEFLSSSSVASAEKGAVVKNPPTLKLRKDAYLREKQNKIGSCAWFEELQTINETAPGRVIGLTIETRPDWITKREIKQLRQLGVTRVELGMQSADDAVLEKIKRGHGTAEVKTAAKLLKDAAFKVDFHYMPQLPGSNPDNDVAGFKEIFDNPEYRPDMIKIYPCTVVQNSLLYAWWKLGRYKPYSNEELIEAIIKMKTYIPRYARISRLIRDIPSTEIAAGNVITNLRETIQGIMKERGLQCNCLRCREVGHQLALGHRRIKLFIDEYAASGGREYFISFEDLKRRVVLAFLRLRLPAQDHQPIFNILKQAALIRELHTYGLMMGIGQNKMQASQHKGLGTKLMAEAECVARAAGYKKMAVISGVGVREYYKKFGYTLKDTYMVKDF